MATKGLWSVTKINFLPYKYWKNFFKAQDDGQRVFLYLAVIALTNCERFGNVSYWSFTSSE